jgi:hypothetical protein
MIGCHFLLGLAAMKDAYSELEGIWSRCIENNRKNMVDEILDLLKEQGTRGIRIRQDNGELRQLTLSRPTSVNSSFVIGLRYVKRNGKQTEDLFPGERGRPIKGYYKGSLQRQWTEYRGTHDLQVGFTIVANESAPTTLVNTISLVKKDRQRS